MPSVDETPRIEVPPNSRHRWALLLTVLGVVATLLGWLRRDGAHESFNWRVLLVWAIITIVLYAFWRWAINMGIRLARALSE